MAVLVAREAFPYAGRSISIGEVFSAPEEDANLLKLVGRAEDATPILVRKDLTADAPRVKRKYQRKVILPEPTE